LAPAPVAGVSPSVISVVSMSWFCWSLIFSSRFRSTRSFSRESEKSVRCFFSTRSTCRYASYWMLESAAEAARDKRRRRRKKRGSGGECQERSGP
jgi:hypothetical protein